jgi:hypothetical protein
MDFAKIRDLFLKGRGEGKNAGGQRAEGTQ